MVLATVSSTESFGIPFFRFRFRFRQLIGCLLMPDLSLTSYISQLVNVSMWMITLIFTILRTNLSGLRI